MCCVFELNRSHLSPKAFPSGFNEQESDPMLMCDFWSSRSKGVARDPDEFEVPWHPHRGQDICTYMKSGVGRHADSMGNRGSYPTPGIQWISVGSGIEHAEGGGTPEGELSEGFQIWINVPSAKKMDNPRYGTDPAPPVELGPSKRAWILAGSTVSSTGAIVNGPFKTVVPLEMLDLELDAGTQHDHSIAEGLNNALLFCYAGAGKVNGVELSQHQVMRLDASDDAVRSFHVEATSSEIKLMLFAGRRLGQPIAWHGPFVMTTQEELQRTFKEYSNGQFPPVRAEWDYKRWADFPESHKKQHDDL